MIDKRSDTVMTVESKFCVRSIVMNQKENPAGFSF